MGPRIHEHYGSTYCTGDCCELVRLNIHAADKCNNSILTASTFFNSGISIIDSTISRVPTGDNELVDSSEFQEQVEMKSCARTHTLTSSQV
jgi:hypothetical protein